MDAGIVAGSFADLLAAALFAYVGWRLSRRAIPETAKSAARGFHVWWLSIGLIWGLEGLRGLAFVAGLTDGAGGRLAFALLYYAFLLLLCVGLWGLLTYVVYLYQGRDASRLLAFFYGAYFLVAAGAVAYAQPGMVTAGTWTTTVPYERPLPAWSEALLFLFLLVPQLVGAGSYLLLARRVGSPGHRFRIGVVAGTLLAWIGINLVADLAGWTAEGSWQIARRAIGVGAALAILAAYHPPGSVRRWIEARERAWEGLA